VSSGKTVTRYDAGSADVFDSPDDHVALTVEVVDEVEVIKGCSMGVVALSDAVLV
jgi:hypothetical protein